MTRQREPAGFDFVNNQISGSALADAVRLVENVIAVAQLQCAGMAALLVDLAELPFKFGDLFSRYPFEGIVGNQQYELPILHDLRFQFHALVFVTHDIIPTSFD
ncbi:hypothetical protein [Bradyrhizobium sp. URHC0002]